MTDLTDVKIGADNGSTNPSAKKDVKDGKAALDALTQVKSVTNLSGATPGADGTYTAAWAAYKAEKVKFRDLREKL